MGAQVTSKADPCAEGSLTMRAGYGCIVRIETAGSRFSGLYIQLGGSNSTGFVGFTSVVDIGATGRAISS